MNLFVVVIASLSVFTYLTLDSWTEEVVQTNVTLTRLAAEQFRESAQGFLDSLGAVGFFEQQEETRETFDILDNRAKLLANNVLSDVRGLEGGLFITRLDEFIGYSYPSSPPPVPVYGPPPRSYAIIKKQVLETISQNREIANLHQFDPAIFPLTTVPLVSDGKVVGAAWTRIHIERELPATKLRKIINTVSLISVVGFVVAVLISVVQKRKFARLHADMLLIREGKSRLVTETGGTIGEIGRSVNRMIKALEEEHSKREQLERALNQREKMAALGNLVAGVVHEVKTPLAIIKTRVQMWQRGLAELNQGEDSEPIKDIITDDSLQMIVHETNRLSRLVNRLLVFSRPIVEKQRKTDLAAVLNHTIEFLKSSLRNRNVKIQFDGGQSIPPVMADPNSIEQVFLNVLTNAAEAVDDEGRIWVTTELSEPEDHIVVRVRDNGSGIPDEIRSVIFDPFASTKDKGFGLGLAIAYEIVSAHGGTIEFTDAEGGGTVCTITIPITKGNQESA